MLAGPWVLAQDVSFVETTTLVDMTGTNPAVTGPPFSSGISMGVVDLNGDRRDDIVRIHDYRELNLEFQNAPNVAFTNYGKGLTATGRAWSVCAADVDGNGINDIVVGGNSSGSDAFRVPSGLELFLANGDGTAHTRSMITTDTLVVQGTIFSDLDGDGDLDVFACDDTADLEKYLNNGSGLFTSNFNAVPTAFPLAFNDSGNYAILATDYDGDGDIDYYLSKCQQGENSPASLRRINRLFERRPSGYVEVAAARGLADGAQTWSADFGDIDNDGDLDAFILNHQTTYSDESGLYLNDGSGNFTNITVAANLAGRVNQIGGQAFFRDFDNDTDLDLICSSLSLDQYDYFRNNGDNTFTELFGVMKRANLAPVDKLHSFAIGDLNHDGFLDLYAGRANSYYAPTNDTDLLLLNQGNSNGFLSVTLAGSAANRNGIGARIEVHGPWGVQVREVRGGEGYGIMNSLNTHFGLGTATKVDKVVVKWPSGTVDEVFNVKGNRFGVVHEGTDAVALRFADWIRDFRAPGDQDGEGDSPDGDPVPNLFEQLMGTNPNERSVWSGLRVSVVEDLGQWLLVELDRVPVQDVQLALEVSGTGSGWETPEGVEVLEDSPLRYAARIRIDGGARLARLSAQTP